jgi:hypothetical protein
LRGRWSLTFARFDPGSETISGATLNAPLVAVVHVHEAAARAGSLLTAWEFASLHTNGSLLGLSNTS